MKRFFLTTFLAIFSIAWAFPGVSPPVAYTVGGTLYGLSSGQSVVLQDNGADNLTLSASGVFTFATAVANGASYSVTVLTQPINQTCTVAHGSGNISNANVTNVVVSCISTPPVFPISIATTLDLGIPTNRAQNQLSASINATTTDIPLGDASLFSNYPIISIGNEIMKCTAKIGLTLVGCVRGYDNTSAAIHLKGAPVNGNVVASYLNLRDAETISIENHLSVFPLSVTDYGAKCDGITDDTAAIQLAVNRSFGRSIFVPAGTCNISSIMIASSNTRIYGTGPGSVLHSSDPAQAIYIHGTSTLTGVQIDHLRLTGTPTNLTAKGISFNNVTDSTVDSVVISGFTNAGIYSTSGVSFDRMRILNNTITDGDFGIAWQGGADILVQGNTCINQTLTNYPPHGIYVKGDSPRTRVIGNTVTGTSGGTDAYGIEVYGSPTTTTGTIISDNTVYNAEGGIEVSLTSGVVVSNNTIYTTTLKNGINFYDTNTNAIIVGNKIYSATERGIALIPVTGGTTGASISGNSIYGVGLEGIRVESASSVTITANTLNPFNVGSYTILVRASTNVTITGNTIVCSQRGVLADTSGGPLVIANNIITDGVAPASYPIYVAGITYYTIRDNEITASGTIFPNSDFRIFPNANSTTGVQILKADRTTHLMDADTTNGRFTLWGRSALAPLRIIPLNFASSALDLMDLHYGAGNGVYVSWSTGDKSDMAWIKPISEIATRGLRYFSIFGNQADSGVPTEMIRWYPTGRMFFPTRVAFADLGAPTDGMILFCNNCTPASNPCTAGSYSVFAFGQQSKWVCF